mgnify:CR=1 FL=1
MVDLVADMQPQPMDMVHTVKHEKLPFWAVFLCLKSYFSLIKNMDKNSIKSCCLLYERCIG